MCFAKKPLAFVEKKWTPPFSRATFNRMADQSLTASPEIRFDHRHYYNRELSWLRFNFRVLQEGLRQTNPLLERLKFLAIVANNLDEFFEVRVAGLEQKLASDIATSAADGLTPKQSLKRIYRMVGIMLDRLYGAWHKDILTNLRQEGYGVLNHDEYSERQMEFVETYFQEKLYPVLTPIKIDSAHPFPWVINKALCIAALLQQADEEEYQLGVITIPRVLPRIITLPSDSRYKQSFTFLPQVVEANIRYLFKGYNILGVAPFRITRNSNLYLNEEEESNLLRAVEKELLNRRKGDAVRMEIRQGSPQIAEELRKFFHLRHDQVNQLNGPVNFNRVMALYKLIDRNDLKDASYAPRDPEWLGNESIFAKIREKDILLHHPYDSFHPILHLIEKAASDPNVLSIKITLYRTGDESPIINSLLRAASNGKEVTVVLELMARFDEASNVVWAKHLLEHGVHVVYGLLGYKTHCKLMMIVREEGNRIMKYVHVGTGNYNEQTARLYTDLSIFTCREELTQEVLEVFNVLTSQSRNPQFEALIVSPFNSMNRFLELIDAEAAAARAGKPARIFFKVNALQEDDIVRALYRASMAGVQIHGIVRGICCLKAGRRPYSENIRISSIVSRFLEHSRIYYFENAPHRIYIGSADWMPRNLRRRVEVVAPILDPDIEKEVRSILELQLADTYDSRVAGKAWSAPSREDLESGARFSAQHYFMTQRQEKDEDRA